MCVRSRGSSDPDVPPDVPRAACVPFERVGDAVRLVRRPKTKWRRPTELVLEDGQLPFVLQVCLAVGSALCISNGSAAAFLAAIHLTVAMVASRFSFWVCSYPGCLVR